MKLWGVTGWKNSGKTGLMERLVTEFSSRGLTVSTVKHAHHSFDVDHKGRDSYRHREAGAKEVLLSSRKEAIGIPPKKIVENVLISLVVLAKVIRFINPD